MDGKARERMIPFVSAFVDKVDLAGKSASPWTGNPTTEAPHAL